MAYVSGASLQPIVNRLNSAEPYHPLEANTFADWSLEAGDTVTVSRDGTSYASPVHTSKLTWRKQAQVAISSTGNETRESISKLSSQRYRSGNSGLRNSHYQHIYVNDLYDQMTSGLELTGSTASLYVQNLYDQMKAGLDLTSSSASLYVQNLYRQMKSGLELTSSSASLYVQSMYDQMKAGLDLTSSSARLYARTVDIEASRVKITGNTYLNGILSVANGRVKIDGATLIDGDLLLSTSLSIRTGNDDYTITAAAISTMIKSASVTNNVLTLTRVNGTTVNFSKATTLYREDWSSGHLQVKAKQTNYNTTTNEYEDTVVATFHQYLFDSGVKQKADGTTYAAGTDWYVPVYFADTASGTKSATGCRIHVNPTVTAGVTSVTWDSTNKKFKATGYAYINGGSQAVDSAEGTSSVVSIDSSANWSNGSKSIAVKHGSSSILTGSISIPDPTDTYWDNVTGHTWRARLTIGGGYKYSATRTFYTEAEYNAAAGSVPSGYIKAPAYIMTDGNRYQNWYTCALYDSNYNYITTIAGGSYSGMYIPLMDAGTLEAGTYSATASTGNYGGVYLGYRSFTVPSSGGSSGPSHYDNFAVSVTQNASGNHVSITKTYPLSSSCPFSNTSSKRFYWN